VNILIACEFSGIVRDCFISNGHNAISIDLLNSERPGPHIIGNILEHLDNEWDMMIAFPPCTDLSSSGAWKWKEKQANGSQAKAIEFFQALVCAPIPLIAIENPIGIMSTAYRKPDQIIQPWQYGHGETKATCLWLKGLPPLTPTEVVSGRVGRILSYGPSKDRWKLRSKTYQGIAQAMADQWGDMSHPATKNAS